MSEHDGLLGASAADERLRALSEAASPGKWFTDPADEPGRVSAVTVMEPVARTVARATSYGRKEADAEFIAAAVNHLRAALARSAAARAEADALRAAVQRVRADTLREAMRIVHRATPATDTPLTFDGARTRIRGLIEAEYNRALPPAEPVPGSDQ
jgi:hypothetical protein